MDIVDAIIASTIFTAVSITAIETAANQLHRSDETRRCDAIHRSDAMSNIHSRRCEKRSDANVSRVAATQVAATHDQQRRNRRC